MLLMLVRARSVHDDTERGLSVWIQEPDPAAAEARVRQRLAAAGWTLTTVDGTAETSEEDYFRPCASQQAYRRAVAEGIAWRFDDSEETGP